MQAITHYIVLCQNQEDQSQNLNLSGNLNSHYRNSVKAQNWRISQNVWEYIQQFVYTGIVWLDIVTYRLVVKQWLGKQRPLLGNASNIDAHDSRRTVFYMWSAPCNCAVNTPLYNSRGTMFSAWSVPRSYLEDNWLYNWVTGYSPDSNDVSTEEEESPSVGSVTRQRLLRL
jgi:hypothetical protein